MGIRDETIGRFLERVASREPAPGGGAAAAVTVALAAGLTAMAARFATAEVSDAEAIAERADQVRESVVRLGEQDGNAYRAVLEAYALPRQPDPGRRSAAISSALRRATETPLAIAAGGAEIAGLAGRLAQEGNPNLAGDAATAVLLAAATVHSAARLVTINVAAGGLDGDLVEQADRWLRQAARAKGLLGECPQGRGEHIREGP